MGCTRSARMKERAAGAYEVKDKEVKGSARQAEMAERLSRRS